jgi:exopolysaccharide biosynthesis polyprenyl glycosylphosphotransferase
MSEAGSYLDVKVRRLDRMVADRQVSEYVGGDRIADAAQRRDALLRHRNLIRLGLMTGAGVIDLLVIFAAALIAAAIRQGDLGSNNWMQSLGVLAPTYMLAAMTFGAYRMRRLSSFSRSLAIALAALGVATAFGLCAAFALQVGSQFSRLETAYLLLAAVGLLFVTRAIGVKLIRQAFRNVVEPTIIVLADRAEAHAGRGGDNLTRHVDIRAVGLKPSLSDPAFFDRMANMVRDADRVVISLADAEERREWAEVMRISGVDAEIIADLGDVQPLALSDWQGRPTLVISRGPLKLGERLAKRVFDLSVTLALLPIFGPVIAVFAVLVKLDSPGPAFFVQDRVGRNNRTYRCFKLRTMRSDLTDANGGVSASREDRRITRLGKFLRQSSIDELPQLINVLTGDMSLVGPRPHALGSRAEGALFWELVPSYWSRHSMKPGVTGLAQVRGLRGATHVRADIEHRVAADLEYINNWSLWLDLKIVVRTMMVVFHRNAY